MSNSKSNVGRYDTGKAGGPTSNNIYAGPREYSTSVPIRSPYRSVGALSFDNFGQNATKLGQMGSVLEATNIDTSDVIGVAKCHKLIDTVNNDELDIITGTSITKDYNCRLMHLAVGAFGQVDDDYLYQVDRVKVSNGFLLTNNNTMELPDVNTYWNYRITTDYNGDKFFGMLGMIPIIVNDGNMTFRRDKTPLDIELNGKNIINGYGQVIYNTDIDNQYNEDIVVGQASVDKPTQIKINIDSIPDNWSNFTITAKWTVQEDSTIYSDTIERIGDTLLIGDGFSQINGILIRTIVDGSEVEAINYRHRDLDVPYVHGTWLDLENFFIFQVDKIAASFSTNIEDFSYKATFKTLLGDSEQDFWLSPQFVSYGGLYSDVGELLIDGLWCYKDSDSTVLQQGEISNMDIESVSVKNTGDEIKIAVFTFDADDHTSVKEDKYTIPYNDYKEVVAADNIAGFMITDKSGNSISNTKTMARYKFFDGSISDYINVDDLWINSNTAAYEVGGEYGSLYDYTITSNDSNYSFNIDATGTNTTGTTRQKTVCRKSSSDKIKSLDIIDPVLDFKLKVFDDVYLCRDYIYRPYIVTGDSIGDDNGQVPSFYIDMDMDTISKSDGIPIQRGDVILDSNSDTAISYSTITNVHSKGVVTNQSDSTLLYVDNKLSDLIVDDSYSIRKVYRIASDIYLTIVDSGMRYRGSNDSKLYFGVYDTKNNKHYTPDNIESIMNILPNRDSNITIDTVKQIAVSNYRYSFIVKYNNTSLYMSFNSVQSFSGHVFSSREDKNKWILQCYDVTANSIISSKFNNIFNQYGSFKIRDYANREAVRPISIGIAGSTKDFVISGGSDYSYELNYGCPLPITTDDMFTEMFGIANDITEFSFNSFCIPILFPTSIINITNPFSVDISYKQNVDDSTAQYLPGEELTPDIIHYAVKAILGIQFGLGHNCTGVDSNTNTSVPRRQVLSVFTPPSIAPIDRQYNTTPQRFDELTGMPIENIGLVGTGTVPHKQLGLVEYQSKLYTSSKRYRLVPADKNPIIDEVGNFISNGFIVARSNKNGSSIYIMDDSTKFTLLGSIPAEIVSSVYKAGGLYTFATKSGIYTVSQSRIIKLYNFTNPVEHVYIDNLDGHSFTYITNRKIGLNNIYEFYVADIYGSISKLDMINADLYSTWNPIIKYTSDDNVYNITNGLDVKRFTVSNTEIGDGSFITRPIPLIGQSGGRFMLNRVLVMARGTGVIDIDLYTDKQDPLKINIEVGLDNKRNDISIVPTNMIDISYVQLGVSMTNSLKPMVYSDGTDVVFSDGAIAKLPSSDSTLQIEDIKLIGSFVEVEDGITI